jgi:hypothetical protein
MNTRLLILSLTAQIALGFHSASNVNILLQTYVESNTGSFMSESALDPDPSSSSKSSMKGKTQMSEAIPFLKCPSYLNGALAGDVGFDPLGLGKNEDVLLEMREAEMKHARLAMLAAAGWPLSELFDKQIASYFDITPMLDSADRAPSLLNGGLDKIAPEWWGFCLGMTGAIDIFGVQRARTAESSSENGVIEIPYFPGNLGFDPFGLYPLEEEERKQMQLAEIKHGRVAMMAVVGFSAQEALLKIGVVDETPFFFKPLL